MYDPQLGRFHTIDPYSDSYYSLSHYGYCKNDPIRNVDVDGEWVWAAVGAALDYGLQVYDNYGEDKSGYDAWVGDVNFVSVGLSAVNPMGKFKLAKTLVVEGAKAAVEWTPSSGVNVSTDVGDIATKAVLNTAINVGSTKVSNKLGNISSDAAVKGAKANVVAKSKNLTKANNSVKNSNIKSKSNLPMEAFKEFDAAKTNLSVTKGLNSTAGKVNTNATSKAIGTTTTRVIKKEDEKTQ